jgi:hypothetical protein
MKLLKCMIESAMSCHACSGKPLDNWIIIVGLLLEKKIKMGETDKVWLDAIISILM